MAKVTTKSSGNYSCHPSTVKKMLILISKCFGSFPGCGDYHKVPSTVKMMLMKERMNQSIVWDLTEFDFKMFPGFGGLRYHTVTVFWFSLAWMIIDQL